MPPTIVQVGGQDYDKPGGESDSFTTTGPFMIYSKDFGTDEEAILLQEFETGVFRPVYNSANAVKLSRAPNTAYIPQKGTFKFDKSATDQPAALAWELQ